MGGTFICQALPIRILMLEPPKKFSVVKQKWIKNEEVNGYRCAKISFSIKDQWHKPRRLGEDKDIGDREFPIGVWRFSVTGVVYFAIEEGIVVMETSRIDMSFTEKGGSKPKEQWLWEKNLILLHYEPLTEKIGDDVKRKVWRYTWQPPRPFPKPRSTRKKEQTPKATEPWKPHGN